MPAKVTRSRTVELWARDVPDAVARAVLTRAGATLAAAAKRTFQRSGHVASGSIMKTITPSTARLKATSYGGHTFEAWVVTVGPLHPAAKWVTRGRRKGSRMPPPDAILKWMDIRGITPEVGKGGNMKKAKMSLAWAIAVSIARDGIKPFPFMAIAFRENKQLIRQQIRDDLKKGLSRSR
jgi:hypothetical protein